MATRQLRLSSSNVLSEQMLETTAFIQESDWFTFDAKHLIFLPYLGSQRLTDTGNLNFRVWVFLVFGKKKSNQAFTDGIKCRRL